MPRRKLSARAHLYQFVPQRDAAFLLAALGLPADRIRVIPNGVDVELFQPMDRQWARRRLGLPEEGQLIVSVSTLIPTKGHHLLVSAAAELAERYPALRPYIIGEGSFRPQLESAIRDKGLQGRAILVGNKPQGERWCALPPASTWGMVAAEAEQHLASCISRSVSG